MEWRLAEAKNKFSELVNRALKEGPQRVTRHKDAVIILSEEDYEKLTGARPSSRRSSSSTWESDSSASGSLITSRMPPTRTGLPGFAAG